MIMAQLASRYLKDLTVEDDRSKTKITDMPSNGEH